jgi:hypothetical protein
VAAVTFMAAMAAFTVPAPAVECAPPVVVCPPVVRYVEQPTVVVCPPVVRYVEQPTVVVQQVPATETFWVQNSNGSMTPVTLRRADNGMYVGPKGEFYMGFPTIEQLRQLYGL